MSRYVPASEEARFAQALQDQGFKPPSAFVIPVLQNDPPANDPTNLWMRPDGRLRGRYWNGSAWVNVDYPMRSDITAPPAVPAAPAPAAQPPAPRTYRTAFAATWTQSYKGDDSKRTDSNGDLMLMYGNSGDANGTNKSLIGFNYSSIASTLTSSTIKKVELSLTNVDAYWDSGVDIYFGIHNVTAEPATWPADLLPRRKISKHHFEASEAKTVTLPLEFATMIRAGTGKGIAIEAPNASRDFYGYAAGVGSGFAVPQLIVTYAK